MPPHFVYIATTILTVFFCVFQRGIIRFHKLGKFFGFNSLIRRQKPEHSELGGHLLPINKFCNRNDSNLRTSSLILLFQDVNEHMFPSFKFYPLDREGIFDPEILVRSVTEKLCLYAHQTIANIPNPLSSSPIEDRGSDPAHEL